MSTFSQIKELIRKNLEDNNVTFYSSDDLRDSVQDGYNDIVIRSRCITKKTTVDWQQGLVYYDMVSLGVTDWLGTIAIHDNNINRFLDDNLNLLQLDSHRIDWELAKGTPRNWIPINNKYFVVYPIYTTASGNFDLYYWGKAPTVVDADTPLIATDMQSLLEIYSTADLIEQAEEYVKAEMLWEEYFTRLEQYKERCDRLAKTDLLLLA